MRRLQSILFATDFRSASRDAADVAVRLTSTFGSRVTLFHVLESLPTWSALAHQNREHATDELRKLAAQLAEIGVKPADVTFVTISHTHGDHVGNVDMFPASTLLMQKAEFDFAFAAGKNAPFKAERPIRKLEGDLDVFGDGSVAILSTPGHTPGHQSLLVHLSKTGWLVLSGDAAHFKDNWDNKRVASMNTSADQTMASFKRISDVMADKKAQLWINHDLPQSQSQKHSPQFYD